ncbi:MAG: hypothetical protein NVV59_19455 [Chitinophagaceae bacterium]|nr:hypothetical protein [Chitinophagaceae bacterium]
METNVVKLEQSVYVLTVELKLLAEAVRTGFMRTNSNFENMKIF